MIQSSLSWHFNLIENMTITTQTLYYLKVMVARTHIKQLLLLLCHKAFGMLDNGKSLKPFFPLSAIGTPFKEVKQGWHDEMLHSRLMMAEFSPDYSLISILLARHRLSIRMDVPLSCAH